MAPTGIMTDSTTICRCD